MIRFSVRDHVLGTLIAHAETDLDAAERAETPSAPFVSCGGRH